MIRRGRGGGGHWAESHMLGFCTQKQLRGRRLGAEQKRGANQRERVEEEATKIHTMLGNLANEVKNRGLVTPRRRP